MSVELIEGALTNVPDAKQTQTIVYRDPNDVWLLSSLSKSLMAIAVLLAVSLVANGVMYLRRPDRIVAVRSADGAERVIVLDNRNYGEIEGISIKPDELGLGDKIYLAKRCTELFYSIDPQRRADDMKQFFGLLHPSFATGLSKMLQEKRIPQTEREESWQSVWTLKTAELDKRDPYIVRVVGQQELTKTLEGAVKRETKLIQVEVKLAADKRGRTDENLRTGFVPIGMQEKVLSAQPQ